MSSKPLLTLYKSFEKILLGRENIPILTLALKGEVDTPNNVFKMLECWRKVESQVDMQFLEDAFNSEEIFTLSGNEKEIWNWCLFFIQDSVRWIKYLKTNSPEKFDFWIKIIDANGQEDVTSSKIKSLNCKRKIEPRFFFGLCPISNTILSQHPKTCAGCLSVAYENKEYQKTDWKRHKTFCKVMQPFVKSEKIHPLSGDLSKTARFHNLLTNVLGRSLTQFESDLLNYPRLCMVCLNGDQGRLMDCPTCKCVTYCCKSHLEEDAEDHAKSCQLLRTCMYDYRSEITSKDYPSDYYKPRITRFMHYPLPKEGSDAFFKHDAKLGLKEATDTDIRYLTFRYTGPLTVLRGLEICELTNQEQIVIEIVGARTAETNDITKWELISSQLPQTKKITFVFIGPELSHEFEKDYFMGISDYLRKERPDLVQVFIFKQLDYALYTETRQFRPNLVIALNCGFIFYDSWNKSIPLMISAAPLLFTEYYLEDAELNLTKIRNLAGNVKVVMEPKANAFCSSLPARIPTGFAFRKFKRRNVVMSNDFICIVKTS